MTDSTHAHQFAALGNPLRLEGFRYVIQAGDAGRPAGDIARHLGIAPSTLSAHLTTLQNSGLLQRRRDRQRVIYSVDADAVRTLVAFLLEDCCRGQPELCGISLTAGAGDACC